MEVKIIAEDKNSIDIQIDNLTIAEVLRAYLNKEGAKIAVWRRDHPSKPAVLHVESDNPKKLVKSTISKLEKELDSIISEVKKLK